MKNVLAFSSERSWRDHPFAAGLRLAAIITGLAIALPFSGTAAVLPLAQDYVPIFHNPDDHSYVEGCGLSRLADGSLLAVVPVVPRLEWSKEMRMEHSRIHVLRSTDGGQHWNQSSELPYYSAKAWEYNGALYLFALTPGTAFRNDNLLLLKSPDSGAHWSAPVTLFTGHFWNCDTGMVIKGNRLYWAVDDLSFGAKRGPCVLSGQLDQDLMDPKSWRLSNSVSFPGIPAAMSNPAFAQAPSQFLEPNVIEVNGRIRVLATVKPNHQASANICAVFDLTDDGQKMDLHFTQYSSMTGGQLKFCVLWDEVSKMFWATANMVVDSQGEFDWWSKAGEGGNFAFGEGRSGGNDRRILMLLYSLDGLNWFQAGCVAKAGKISQSFMYARPVIDGNDLAIIARSSVNAPNQHDADYATFHRVHNFRNLALNLFPDSK